jgi:hypothetical protein
MTNQDVVVSEMGIAAGAALPGPSPALLACRGAAAGAMSLRYLDLAAAAARSASCTWADAMRASSPTRSRAAADVDEFTAWMVSLASTLLCRALVFLTRVGSLRTRGCMACCLQVLTFAWSPAEEAPVGARQVRPDCQRVQGEEDRHVPGLRRHALPHRRRPRHGLHERRGEASSCSTDAQPSIPRRPAKSSLLTDASPLAGSWCADEGGGARRREALPDGDRERALPRQGTLPAPLVSTPRALDTLIC